MKPYEERENIDKIYEKARKRIKERITQKGCDCKGQSKGRALDEIIAVLDDELEIGIAQDLEDARKEMYTYCRKYEKVENLDRKIQERQEKLKELESVKNMVDLLTDDVLKNAIIAYNSIDNSTRYTRGYSREDAKDIAIAYIKSKGREDLETIIKEQNNDRGVISRD